jgi:HSP20 family protein
MDYIKIRFGDDFDEISSKFEKSIEDMFRSVNPMFNLSERAWSPSMDIYETSDEIIIRVEIAGVEKEKLEVEINSKAVRVFGSRTEMPRVAGGTYRLAEIQYGKFERIVFLPAPIDTEVVSSSYSSGLLQLRLAKLPQAKTYTIPIDEK